MIIRKGDGYYSIEKIIKKNIFSESRNGNIILHSRLIYKNPVLLTTSTIDTDAIKEVPLWVSPRGRFGFRNLNWDINFVNIPIEGNFLVLDNGIKYIYDSDYRILAKVAEKSRRYISESQLDEIRKFGSYEVEYENNYYWFIKIADCPVEQRNELRFYKLESFKDISKVVLLKNTDRFFLKIPAKNLHRVGTGKAKCGISYEVYKVDTDIRFLRKIFEKNFTEKTEIMVFGGKHEARYFSTKMKFSKTESRTGHIARHIETDDFYIAISTLYSSEFENIEKNLLVELPPEFVFKELSD